MRLACWRFLLMDKYALFLTLYMKYAIRRGGWAPVSAESIGRRGALPALSRQRHLPQRDRLVFSAPYAGAAGAGKRLPAPSGTAFTGKPPQRTAWGGSFVSGSFPPARPARAPRFPSASQDSFALCRPEDGTPCPVIPAGSGWQPWRHPHPGRRGKPAAGERGLGGGTGLLPPGQRFPSRAAWRQAAA